jgi:malonate-semialdehyde dehydrogenase (acetylating)/methylmalonate-semialdehyde dehydrogenase
MKDIRHWIGGKPSDRPSERWGEVYDPATGQQSGRVAFATEADVDAAVASAVEASKTWRFASLAKRTRVLFAFRELVEKHKARSPASSPPSTARSRATRSARSTAASR